MKLEILSPFRKAWNGHMMNWYGCTRCPSGIGELAHRHVFARGRLPCDILFIGEGPGKTEDVTGFPFVGKAGRLLDWWMEGLSPEISWAVTNLVLCRPCDGLGAPNRAPTRQEKDCCRPRLFELIEEVAKPLAFVLLGKQAAATLSSDPAFTARSSYLLELDHPAYVNYNGGKRSELDTKNKARLAAFVQAVERLKNGKASRQPAPPPLDGALVSDPKSETLHGSG